MDIKSAMEKVSVKRDGVDHLWVSPFSGTQFGKIISLKWRKKFFIPQLGEFVSPDAFLAWMFSGDEAQRQNPTARLPQVSKENFSLARQAMFLAKYHQLTALRPALIAETKVEEGKKSPMDLPWFEYKQHLSGVKEYHFDTLRVSIVKDMVNYVLVTSGKDSAKTPFSSQDFDYTTTMNRVMAHVKDMFGLDDVVEKPQPKSGKSKPQVEIDTGEDMGQPLVQTTDEQTELNVE